MKRMHLHVSVTNIAQSIGFYSTLFGAPPTVTKTDYAKWLLEDPRVNFAISQRGAPAGVDHIGIQTECSGELAARGDKSWVKDPAGVRWETFFTFREATTYGEDPAMAELQAVQTGGACCGAVQA